MHSNLRRLSKQSQATRPRSQQYKRKEKIKDVQSSNNRTTEMRFSARRQAIQEERSKIYLKGMVTPVALRRQEAGMRGGKVE